MAARPIPVNATVITASVTPTVRVSASGASATRRARKAPEQEAVPDPSFDFFPLFLVGALRRREHACRADAGPRAFGAWQHRFGSAGTFEALPASKAGMVMQVAGPSGPALLGRGRRDDLDHVVSLAAWSESANPALSGPLDGRRQRADVSTTPLAWSSPSSASLRPSSRRMSNVCSPKFGAGREAAGWLALQRAGTCIERTAPSEE